MKKIIFLFLLSPIFVFSQSINDFFPTNNGQLVNHTYYTISYSEEHEQAEWVFYEIKKDRMLNVAKRKDNFRIDKKISTNSATLLDYKGSGFDRGHLAPAKDFSFNATAMSESFFMSNMSPQHPSFNRGIWKKLESLVRDWGNIYSIYVVTGPVLNDCSLTIGINNVCVPKYYYKIIYEPKNHKMISFLLPNIKGTKDLYKYVCTTDSLEEITNIDFFQIIEDDLEDKIESTIEKRFWTNILSGKK